MLLTIFVLYYVRPLLKNKERRNRAVSLLLIASCIPVGYLPAPNAIASKANGAELGKRYSVAASKRDTNNSDAASPANDARRVREGTRTARTIGRVINLGRRWAFVPSTQDASGSLPERGALKVHAPSLQSPVTPQHAASLQDATARSSFANSQSRQTPRPDGSAGRNFRSATSAATSATAPAANNGKPPHIILCENQMLQRIVEAIQADGVDDRWVISGEILEFFDQNRLLIQTAQRADAE